MAMMRFVTSDAHAEAIRNAPVYGATGKVTHWRIDAGDVASLDWDVARAKLRAVEPNPVFD